MSASPGPPARIEAFLRARFNIGPEHDLSGDVDLFKRGYVDSVGVVELVEFLSAEFGVDVPEDSLLSDDFSSVEGIARIVQHLHGAGDEARP